MTSKRWKVAGVSIVTLGLLALLAWPHAAKMIGTWDSVARVIPDPELPGHCYNDADDDNENYAAYLAYVEELDDLNEMYGEAYAFLYPVFEEYLMYVGETEGSMHTDDFRDWCAAWGFLTEWQTLMAIDGEMDLVREAMNLAWDWYDLYLGEDASSLGYDTGMEVGEIGADIGSPDGTARHGDEFP